MSKSNPHKRPSRAAQDKMDIDYMHKLSPEDRAWMFKFNAEYCQAYFRKNEVALHESPEERRKIYSACNAARRDVWNQFFRLPVGDVEGLADEEA